MKRIMSVVVAVMLMTVSLAIPAFAEETSGRVVSYSVIPAEGEQVELGYTDATTILEVDGLKFKDLNKNGELDIYEDWRQDTEARVLDLISQMTIEEKTGLFYHLCTCGDSTGVDFSDSRYLWAENSPFEDTEHMNAMLGGCYSMYYFIHDMQVNHFLDNSNGTPEQQIEYHNAMQIIGEETRLGIPVTLSSDRQYNAWGGMIDTPHDAFGTANDVELATKLWTLYSKETRAIGYHVVLHPYGVEIGSWNGEDPEYVGEMAKAEVEAIQVEGGTVACIKHFIARGGDSSFADAHSDAWTIENWITPWKKAFEANPQWLMTNGYNSGLYEGVNVDYDRVTMSYLRDTLGYEGIIVSDWGAQIDERTKGVTVDGVDVATFSIPERYALVINNGVDQIGNPSCAYLKDIEGPVLYSCVRDGLQMAYEEGLITEERLLETCYRVLKNKFDLGLFENPYSDAEYALSLSASAEYANSPWEVVDMETLQAARNLEEVELERQLQAESAVLVKNEENLLPLEKGIKVYVATTGSTLLQAGYEAALAEYATVVNDMADADIVIADCTQINDAAELIVEDAMDEGKKIVFVANSVDPNAWAIESSDAVLFLNFSRAADHGTGAGGFITTTEPVVFAQLLFGDREPSGMIVKEIARDSAMDDAQWKDLAGDQGASDWVRLMLLATMRESENNVTPNNWGDPLLQYKYGMRYGQDPEFVYDTVILPKAVITEFIPMSDETKAMYRKMMNLPEDTDMSSYGNTVSTVINQAKVGEPFKATLLMWNKGADGITTVQVYDGETLVAEKVMAICGDSWRIAEIEITLDTAGEHELRIGDMTQTITVVQ